ncbi:MAG: WYL domain-containing protein [Cyanobacteria bacterium P01_H01_bin.15]
MQNIRVKMTRKGKSITLSLTPTDKARLEAIAVEHGKMWGGRPNVSKLIEEIARRKIQLNVSEDWSPFRLHAVYQGYVALLNAGHMEAATELGELLCDRAELPDPQRTEIEQFLHKSVPKWQLEMDQYIRTQQPFKLSFYDAADQLHSYSITHGQIKFSDRVKYLFCRCQETVKNILIADLEHNWSLRLDRITDAVITPLNAQWQTDLDKIVVEFNLYNSLAFSYQEHNDDIYLEFIDTDNTYRRVLRKIAFTQTLFTDLNNLGENCQLISPKHVCTEYVRTLQRWIQHYNLNPS